MKRVPEKSLVKVLQCPSGHHVNMIGHVVGNRRDGKLNLLLTNHEKCVAVKYEVLSLHKTPRKPREISFMERFAMSLYWQAGMRGI